MFCEALENQRFANSSFIIYHSSFPKGVQNQISIKNYSFFKTSSCIVP